VKVILSRKGFDSSNGGLPSLIMPNGDVVSMPIPSDGRVKYSELQYGDKTYWQILKELRPSFASRRSHLDPDLDAARRTARMKSWKPAFGQRGPAASYLMNTVGIEPGDLFLFFGNFRAVEEKKGRYRFVSRTGDFYLDKPVQLIWGYLQVGEIITEGARVRRDYPWHPHANRDRSNDPSNILVVPSKTLSFAPSRPSCGVLPYSIARVLTKKGANKATWTYNPVYAPNAVIGNRKNAVRNGIYYSGIWQELGLKESSAASRWAKSVVLAK
jgi:hypothetical protein